MSPTIKDARRAEWSKLNFAGTIDWALDLQEFTADDFDAPPDRPKSGLGCIQGDERTVNTGDLCAFSCSHGFCPESLCQCLETGPIQDLPPEESGVKMNAFDAFDVDLNRLCSFACKYGHCPDEICKPEVGDSDSDDSDSDDSDGSSKGHRLPIHEKNPYRIDYAAVRRENANLCHVFKDTRYADMGRAPCQFYCQSVLDEAKKQGRTSNYGCVGLLVPLNQEIPWQPHMRTGLLAAPGKCQCDNWLVNELADTVLEAMPAIAQVFYLELAKGIALMGLDWLLYPHVFIQVHPRPWPQFRHSRHGEDPRPGHGHVFYLLSLYPVAGDIVTDMTSRYACHGCADGLVSLPG